MKKDEIMAQLDEAGIEYDASSTKAELEALLPTDDTPETEENTEEETVSEDEFEVTDPEVFQPKELPLLIKPNGGSWKNDAQAEYAATLNGYAYKNPTKWAAKKEKLLANLKRLGEDPAYIVKLRSNVDERLQYKNELTQ